MNTEAAGVERWRMGMQRVCSVTTPQPEGDLQMTACDPRRFRY
jgi:predicted secreted protein